MAQLFTIDTREFDRAMIEYAAASGKDFADISNAKVQEACFWAAKKAKKADAQSVKVLFTYKKLIWWLAHRIREKSNAGGLYDNYARALVRIRLRIQHISFVRAFFLMMAKMMTPFTGKAVKTRVGSPMGFFPFVRAATASNPSAEAGIIFRSRKWDANSKSKVQSLLNSAMQQGINASAANMMIYVDRKMAKTARQYSGVLK